MLTMFLSVFFLSQAAQQMGTLAFYRYEQPIVDYCQAHQPLNMNRGFEPPSQALEGLGARERCAVPSAGLLPSVPAAPLSDIRTLPQWAGDRLVPVHERPRGRALYPQHEPFARPNHRYMGQHDGLQTLRRGLLSLLWSGLNTLWFVIRKNHHCSVWSMCLK